MNGKDWKSFKYYYKLLHAKWNAEVRASFQKKNRSKAEDISENKQSKVVVHTVEDYQKI